MEIEELMKCDGQDSCVCDRLFDLYKVPWSNKFSFTLKQLSIAHCPKVCRLKFCLFIFIFK